MALIWLPAIADHWEDGKFQTSPGSTLAGCQLCTTPVYIVHRSPTDHPLVCWTPGVVRASKAGGSTMASTSTSPVSWEALA